ncbi:serine hydrolase domain-containing protein [uncultured Desulfosarcina sp.]|uniref:serine hydrolase domain-containing protein n=1 Tax=uncultured Desulfosarcina sp. TaxID=218289 RepID=UPI0029C7DB9C|nr:serine hydrolase domain-containing protein [uncultured Desulfosarcina sp.]
MKVDPVDDLMNKGLRERVFPGAVLLAGKGDAELFLRAYGKADLFSNRPMTPETVFDLASLTKPLATALAVARLIDRGQVALDRPAVDWLPELAGDKTAITVRQLLCHRSGLPAHRLFYMVLKNLDPRERKDAVLGLIARTPLKAPPGTKTLYSDLGFMLLCRLVERVAGCTLDRFLAERIYGPMGIDDLFFLPLPNFSSLQRPFAATEFCPVRCRLLKGEVHDDNAWYAGGVDGHAGLFGTTRAVFSLLRRLAAEHSGREKAPVFSKEILDFIFKNDPADHFSLGFDRPAAENSSAGCYFSKNSVGHLGFTGVSFWMDSTTDMTVVLLTNRVHPFRWHNRLVDFRPKIHDRIMEHFGIQAD